MGGNFLENLEFWAEAENDSDKKRKWEFLTLRFNKPDHDSHVIHERFWSNL